MQAAQKSPVRLGAVGTAIDVVKKDSVPGLYRGLTAGLARQLLYGTTRFAVYDMLKARLQHQHDTPGHTSPTSPSMLALVAAASFSGFLGGIVGNPADLANVRMQNDSTLPPDQRRNYRNVFSAWTSMAREPGGFPKNSMRGVWANSTRAAIMTASQLAAYDGFKSVLSSPNGFFKLSPDSSVTHLTASTLAGLVATTLCSPVDVLKTQIMKARADEVKSVGELMRTNFAESGPRWMFRGWVPSFTRLGPQTVATMMILEQHRRVYRWFKGIE
ncbi:mitochondrial dicarboxylate carrier [Elsinoe ampelina]|uniref:Mitochondrial dicarboxylate carrier n=1 Tax=Elsinoe ampelina TaxID=302913 RepID=A0A6A6G930_9PEZI|nr:mitochondrial dicarboxylate carrier [Elsinoe ampelina]